MASLKTKALAGIIVCAILGALAVMYLSGLIFFVSNKVFAIKDVGLLTWYQYWQHYSSDPATAKSLKFSLVAAIVITVGLPIFLLVSAGQKKRELHGSAKFATHTELVKTGLLNNTASRSILIGKVGNQFLAFGGGRFEQQFAFLAAPTRSGKGVGLVIPNLLNYPDSIVVLDLKLENFTITSGFRKSCGQSVYFFAPFSEKYQSHRYNPLGYVSNNLHQRVGDIIGIATILYPYKSKDPFFEDSARNMFLAWALYICETPELPRTIGEMIRQASARNQEEINEIVEKRNEEGRPLSESCTQAFARLTSNSDNTFSSIKSSFLAPLLPFSMPGVDAATSANDFDLRDLRKKPMTIYFGITADKLDEAPLIVNLFFSQLIKLNLKELPKDNPELKYQCLLIMDEFPALGKIDIVAKSVAYIAGYNIRLLPIFQSRSQLNSIYGVDVASNILTNHALQVIYPPREQKDANEYSEMLGYETVKSTSKSHGKSGSSESVSDQRRALLLPQEIKELGEDKEIVTIENCRPIKAEKIIYYLDPAFQGRYNMPPANVPTIDIDLHTAICEDRSRVATVEDVESDAFDLDAFNKNFFQAKEALEKECHSDDEKIEQFTNEFFSALKLPNRNKSDADQEQQPEIDAAPAEIINSLITKIDVTDTDVDVPIFPDDKESLAETPEFDDGSMAIDIRSKNFSVDDFFKKT